MAAGPPSVLRRDALAAALAALAPEIPPFEAGVVIDHALDSRGLKVARPAEAAWLALVAYVRHALTDYDALLDEGYDAESARFFVLDDMAAALAAWGVRRPVTDRDLEAAVDRTGPAP